MSWNIRALVVAAIAAVLLVVPPALRWSVDVTAATTTGLAPAQEQAAAAAGQEQSLSAEPAAQEDADIAAYLAYSGGVVRGKRARTETLAVNIGFPGTWRTLPNATLQYFVGAGTTELFNASLSAECTKFGGGHARIRVLDNGVAMQPYDGARVFCSSSLPATYTANWTRRPPASLFGVWHTLTVQFLNTAGSVTIDDWNFELVVYD